MRFTDRLEGEIVVFKLSGKLGGGEQATRFRGRLHEYLDLNKKKVLVDLAKVEGTTSPGLGLLTSILASVKNADGRLVLVNVEKIENLLAITRLITIFEHYDSYEEAMQALQA
ncbi:MAG: STAS domain-containing protein [Candidatus Zixiibacteriota bacterium]